MLTLICLAILSFSKITQAFGAEQQDVPGIRWQPWTEPPSQGTVPSRAQRNEFDELGGGFGIEET